MDLSNITLVILSHNRQHCLEKTLNFYRNTNLKLLVLDNSPFQLERSLIPENCNYLHRNLPFADRSSIAADLIDTKYTIIGADDEVYLPSSLFLMQDYLEKNPDYIAVGGSAIAVWKYGPNIAATWAYRKTYGYHNNASTAFERIWNHTGGGIEPLTSFFTCNLSRTWAAQSCLKMYAKAPILATDAISVLTICGAGKSKYLDLVYWVRNWNQSPRSHLGWDREITLADWWAKDMNSDLKGRFENDLKEVYEKFSQKDTFEDSWKLVLLSDKFLTQNSSEKNSGFLRFHESTIVKHTKYLVKRIFFPSKLPVTVSQLTLTMKNLGIDVPFTEFNSAARIVSDLRPYKKW